MGCCSSKSNALSHLDDSVKVMVRHDAKMLAKRGQKPGGYVPRAPHPIIDGTAADAEPQKIEEKPNAVTATEE